MTNFLFERNNYYAGKLLTANDFESEQNYFNQKRYFINSLVYGGGVLSGLRVINAGEGIIYVEPGAAIDYSGKEIVLNEAVKCKLHLLDGFVPDSTKPYMYLCLEYAESLKQQAHCPKGITNEESESAHSLSSEKMSNVNYNKTMEGHKLFLTSEEGIKSVLSGKQFYFETVIIHKDENLIITQTVPKYVICGQVFDVEINVRKLKSINSLLSFSYTMNSKYAKLKQRTSIPVKFQESNLSETSYEYTFRLKLENTVSDDYVSDLLVIDKDSIRIQWGQDMLPLHLESNLKFRIDFVKDDIKRWVMNDYFNTDMETLLEQASHNKLYLAKIFFVSESNAGIIGKIENNPFDQYIPNRLFDCPTENVIIQNCQNMYEKINMDILRKYVELALVQPRMVSGTLSVDIGTHSKRGQVFYSDSIIHGLGEGYVDIRVGVISGDNVYYDNEYVFSSKPPVEVGVKANSEHGTFKIGVRILDRNHASSIKIAWYAYKYDKQSYIHKKEITVKPSVANTKCRQTFKFDCIAIGIDPREVVWKVEEAGGGSIDADGLYLAPSTPGVYSITAEHDVHKAKAFIIVEQPTAS